MYSVDPLGGDICSRSGQVAVDEPQSGEGEYCETERPRRVGLRESEEPDDESDDGGE